MPRRARLAVAGIPWHIIQRGNNRQACFYAEADYHRYLQDLGEQSGKFGCQVHAYCLMTNHIHFVVTPDTETSISNTMKVVGSRYAQYVNRKYSRTGTLWEGRHRSSLIDCDNYLLACYRYVELNPVRASMVDHPIDYPWSSHATNVGKVQGFTTPHAVYMNLGKTPERRAQAYCCLFDTPIDNTVIRLVRRSTFYGQPIGSEQFRRAVEKSHGIKPGYTRRGRPSHKR